MIYEYKCRACGHEVLKNISMSRREEPTLAPCENEECGKVEVFQYFGNGATYAFMSPEGLGRKKAGGDFRNLLSIMKKAHPGSTIKDH
jgi:hypothetical protein